MRLSWEYKKIGDICTVERGGSPRPIDDYITDDPDGINWIKIGDTSDSMYITSTAQKIVPEGAKKSRYVQPGDFLLSNSMSFGRPYILKIDGCIHDGWLVLRDNGGLFDKRFLYYCLSAKPTYEKFKMMAVGGVVNNLNSEMVRKVEVPVPSITEQIKVADLLDKVHSLIEKRKQELSAFDDLIKARFVEMFGDPEASNRFPVKKLDALVTDIIAGWSANGETRQKNDDEKAVLKVSAVTQGYFRPEEHKALPSDLEIKKYVFPKKGDLLFSRANTRELVGATAIIEQDYPDLLLPDKLWRVLFTNEINVYYAKYVLSTKSIRSQLSARSTGTSGSMFNVSSDKFRNITIPVPPKALQDSFEAFVHQIDKSKSAIQRPLIRQSS